jgi:hypothetical protein
MQVLLPLTLFATSRGIKPRCSPALDWAWVHDLPRGLIVLTADDSHFPDASSQRWL